MKNEQEVEGGGQCNHLITEKTRDELFLTEKQLAMRWQTSVKKLQKDRLQGTGVQWVRIGRLVRYRLSDILVWERENTRYSTSET